MGERIFIVWNPAHGDQDDGRRVRANHAQGAAEAWAHDDDARSTDYSIVGGDDATVNVLDGDTLTRWIVRGEMARNYYAKEST